MYPDGSEHITSKHCSRGLLSPVLDHSYHQNKHLLVSPRLKSKCSTSDNSPLPVPARAAVCAVPCPSPAVTSAGSILALHAWSVPEQSLETSLARWVADSQIPSLFYHGQHSTQLLAPSVLKGRLPQHRALAPRAPAVGPAAPPAAPAQPRSLCSFTFHRSAETPSRFHASGSLVPCAQRVSHLQNVPRTHLHSHCLGSHLPPPFLQRQAGPSAQPESLGDASGRGGLCRKACRSLSPTSERLRALVLPSVPEALGSL